MSGRGTSGGVVFQAEVGAYAAGLLLTERPLSRIAAGLPGTPLKVWFETISPVDDILIQTDVGEIYVQAKRTISLSSKRDSELASVVEQFVRQFQTGITAPGFAQRDLDPAKDRLLLAVSADTAAPVAHQLREALDRNRTGAATGLPAKLAGPLKTLTKHIETEWLKVIGSPILPSQQQSLLAVCSVAVFSEPQRQLVEEACRDVVAKLGDERTLVELLAQWASEGAKSGTGGDEVAIRLSLSGKIRLKGPPSFIGDIARLTDHTGATVQRLQRFTELATPEGIVNITRPVANVISEAARKGSFVITGDPGAGKSALLHEVAIKLSAFGVVMVLTVESTAMSLEFLRLDIGLEHPLIEVLSKIPANQPAFLLLDALDAVRGGPAEATYKRLIDEVLKLPNWHVVASVRTFDLRLGREWKRLFLGRPFDDCYADPTLQSVRHVHVGLLDAGEMADVGTKSPRIAEAIRAGGPKMEALARTPFNLAIFGDLLSGGVPASALASLSTRGELLQRYWDERIADLGLLATVSLKTMVEQMIDSRSIDVPETSIAIATASTIQELERAGVLVTENSRRIGFRHHVLFDFAVARLILFPDKANVVDRLSKIRGAGLLISPSLGYWLAELKNTVVMQEFWYLVTRLITGPDIDPIVRVEVARLAVESVSENDRLDALLPLLKSSDETLSSVLTQLVGALLCKNSTKSVIFSSPWADLLGKITKPKGVQLGSMRALIGILLNGELKSTGRSSIGIAARTLFDTIGTDQGLIEWLSPQVVGFVAKTYETDIAASRIRLEQLLSPERFQHFGYLEVPWLAREVLSVAAYDADMTVEIYYRVFHGGDFSNTQKTSMSSSWLLSLTSNAAQDFRMASYSLATSFPMLLATFPQTGMRVLGATLKGVRDKHDSRGRGAEHKANTLPYRNKFIPFEEDGSSIWAWEIDEGNHDDYSKIFLAFLSWVESTGDSAVLQYAPDLILQETGCALAWRVLFDAGVKAPRNLGLHLWSAASAAQTLLSLDTRRSAIAMLAAIYQYIPPDLRIAAETTWLQVEFTQFSELRQSRTYVLNTLFEAIGEAQLATEAAQAFLAAAKSQGGSFENEKPYEFHLSQSGERHWLEYEGVDITAPDIAMFLRRINSLKAARQATEVEKSPNTLAALWTATEALDLAITTAKSTINRHIDLEASDELASGLTVSIKTGGVPVDKKNPAIARLLELSTHEDPKPSEETEADFAKSASWGMPSPRIRAAQGLAELVTTSDVWAFIQSRIEELMLTDPHPAVRHQVAQAIYSIGMIDDGAMWSLITRMAAKETNTAVIAHFSRRLADLRWKHAERLEPIIINLAERVPKTGRSGGNTTIYLIAYFAIERGFKASLDTIRHWATNFVKEEERLTAVCSHFRDAMIRGLGNDTEESRTVRARCNDFIWSLLNAVEPAVRAWPQRGGEPTEEELSAFKILIAIGEQLYYATGHGEHLPTSLESLESQRALLEDKSALISRLVTLGSPATVHHLTALVSQLVDANPEQCFDLFSEAMLRTTGVARYEREPAGATQFVELVGRYLADHRSLFDDDVRRGKLMECIAIFVEAGWPEAILLIQSLPELIQ